MAAAAATAAAEAPRSSSSSSSGGGGSADSYIGSLISLTSKSEIRYEGVLYNINALESTIGLRNVRSFGTEGRKKDGPQVPPSDKIYEFILFRGSDIKDLQVKSSPPVQTTTPVHSDPAIIQSQYPQATSVSVALPSSGTSNPTDDGSHTSLLGVPRPSFQGSLPLYQPGGSLSSWGSTPPPPTTNPSGLAMPMYWQGYYGPSNGLQAQQQTFLQPTPGLSMPPPMQPPMQCPPFNASNIPASQLSENPPPKPLLPPFSVSAQNFQAPMLPVQSTGIVSEPANLTLDKPPNQTLPIAPLNSNLPLTSPSPSALDKSAIPPSDSDLPKVVPDRAMPSTNVPEAPLSVMGTSSSVFNEGGTPPLVTPGQFLQPGLSAVPSIQFSETSQKDVEVVQVSSEELPPPASTVAITDVQEPILPLPSPPEHKLHRAPMYSYHANRGRARGRGNEISRSATTFTEDFDFTAMNEKFNKDEIWGDLGKSNKAQDENDSQEDDAGSSKLEAKPVYVKDDFFDSLSCDALDGRSSNGRGRFSEQVRRDTETFGDFPRHRGGRGGWGPGRGGRSRGGYYGRGYYYGGRGRGYYYNMSRAI